MAEDPPPEQEEPDEGSPPSVPPPKPDDPRTPAEQIEAPRIEPPSPIIRYGKRRKNKPEQLTAEDVGEDVGDLLEGEAKRIATHDKARFRMGVGLTIVGVIPVYAVLSVLLIFVGHEEDISVGRALLAASAAVFAAVCFAFASRLTMRAKTIEVIRGADSLSDDAVQKVAEIARAVNNIRGGGGH